MIAIYGNVNKGSKRHPIIISFQVKRREAGSFDYMVWVTISFVSGLQIKESFHFEGLTDTRIAYHLSEVVSCFTLHLRLSPESADIPG